MEQKSLEMVKKWGGFEREGGGPAEWEEKENRWKVGWKKKGYEELSGSDPILTPFRLKRYRRL